MKTSQLQIRVSPAQKAAIRRRAKRAGVTVSEWVLSRLIPPLGARFQDLLVALAGSEQPGHVFAELNDFLVRLPAGEFNSAMEEANLRFLTPYQANYMAAMVEAAAARKGVAPPPWTATIEPLAAPVFGSPLKSLRLHLLTHSPPPFRARNIFIDSSVGDRV